MQKNTKIAIIGGGASGIMCAARLIAKKCIADITIFEKNNRILKKINITGNGRCNVSNERVSSYGFYNNDDFVLPITRKYNDKFISNEFLKLGMVIIKDSDGRYYPASDDAKSVVCCLTNAVSGKVNIRTNTTIKKIEKQNGVFFINNEYFDVLILSVGGASTEKLGCSGDCISLGQLLGYKTVNLMPSLSGIKSSDCEKSLFGIRQNAKAKLYKSNNLIAEEYGQIQFNEGVLSGIAIMNLSRFINCIDDNYYISLNFKEKKEVFAFLKQCPLQLTIGDAMLGILKRPIGNYILKKAGIKKDTPLFKLSKKNLHEISILTEDLKFKLQGVRDFEFSQVSRGGLDLNEFNKDSLSSKKDENFYCIGEALNVDGACGGFNLHFAFASAYLAADNICKKLNG